eukprot:CAMPEP_0202346400 /NCGR_PEP_ID=MMETSP1126-20121109/5207_1 /ASSEMBLY_ACC=CAM_ASM_000457 /TAXON_ID=3047 /ORGANISM="Dunaliella tertiolecta, Strain CCMP1320" /LENGTH=56 /DNA_ID=CAMNT_0048937803 /DNA_START=899 /DNA_END=1069 /DNA_ORIENTATION=+
MQLNLAAMSFTYASMFLTAPTSSMRLISSMPLYTGQLEPGVCSTPPAGMPGSPGAG